MLQMPLESGNHQADLRAGLRKNPEKPAVAGLMYLCFSRQVVARGAPTPTTENSAALKLLLHELGPACPYPAEVVECMYTEFEAQPDRVLASIA